ncbi:MAG: hypothetical protein ABI389_05765 [Rhodanobacter sp.]
MRLLQVVAAFGFSITSSAWAADAPVHAPLHGGSVTVSSPLAARQRMKQDQAEVVRLQREVATQEAASQRAGRRLRQQDRQLAELQRKLAPRRNSPTTSHP